jgi:molybdate transport system regulatory protein
MAMKVLSKTWVVSAGGQIVFGEGRLRMLELVDRLGSMNKAAAQMKMSYRTLWGKLHRTEEELGIRLIETSVGGGGAGGSKLTREARDLMKKYRDLNSKVMTVADSTFLRIFGRSEK